MDAVQVCGLIVLAWLALAVLSVLLAVTLEADAAVEFVFVILGPIAAGAAMIWVVLGPPLARHH